jgi:diacylglycerol kinase family enzyme
VLVRALGLPTDPVECTGMLIAKALDDEATKLNLGRADGRYFAVNCGAGIDASAMQRLEKKFPSTKARYDRVAFRAVAWELMVGYAGKKPDLEVSIDGAEPIPSLSVMVGRTDPYTFYKDRGLRMTPDASLESGLDVLSVRKLNRRNVPRIAWQVFGSARHVQGRDIDYIHDASQVTVKAAEPFPVQVDGDPLGDHRRLQIDLAREALWVVA